MSLDSDFITNELFGLVSKAVLPIPIAVRGWSNLDELKCYFFIALVTFHMSISHMWPGAFKLDSTDKKYISTITKSSLCAILQEKTPFSLHDNMKR